MLLPVFLNGYVKRDPSFGISLEVKSMNKVSNLKSWITCLLVSAHCYLRVRDCCERLVFKYCHNAHVPCKFAERLEKIFDVQTKARR